MGGKIEGAGRVGAPVAHTRRGPGEKLLYEYLTGVRIHAAARGLVGCGAGMGAGWLIPTARAKNEYYVRLPHGRAQTRSM